MDDGNGNHDGAIAQKRLRASLAKAAKAIRPGQSYLRAQTRLRTSLAKAAKTIKPGGSYDHELERMVDDDGEATLVADNSEAAHRPGVRGVVARVRVHACVVLAIEQQ